MTLLTEWRPSWRADPRGAALADRHYTRRRVGSKQFVPPGRCLVLITPCARAVWVTHFPFRRYVKHRWAGAWICSLFRNEGAGLSSALIRSAVRETIEHYGEIPWRGMVTFVAAEKVRSANPGYCFKLAGFRNVGARKDAGHVALQLHPSRMPGLPPYTPSEFAGPARVGRGEA